MSSATAGRLLRACALASTSFRPAGEHPHRADALTSRQSVAVRRPAAVRQCPRSARLDAARLSSTTAHSTTAPQSCQERVGFHASVVGTGAGCASVFLCEVTTRAGPSEAWRPTHPTAIACRWSTVVCRSTSQRQPRRPRYNGCFYTLFVRVPPACSGPPHPHPSLDPRPHGSTSLPSPTLSTHPAREA